MGIIFVLFLWIVFLGCVGIPVAASLAWWSWRNGHQESRPWKARAIMAAALPFILIGMGLVWFVGYAIVSGLRGMDPGLGDSWSIPLTHDYFFCMIDVPDDGNLMRNECSGEAAVYGITQLSQCGDVVNGTNAEGPFLFDTASGTLVPGAQREAVLERCNPSTHLQSPSEFYRAHRSGWPDILALVVLFAMLVSTSLAWHRWFIRRRGLAL